MKFYEYKGTRENTKENRHMNPLEHSVGFPYVSWVPTSPDIVERLVSFAGLNEDDIFFDLGCGDGRILVAAAKSARCHCVGIEASSILCQTALDSAKAAGVGHLIEVRQENIFDADLRNCTCGHIYLHPDLVCGLVPQLNLAAGCRWLVQLHTLEMLCLFARILTVPRRFEAVRPDMPLANCEWLAEYIPPILLDNGRPDSASLDLSKTTEGDINLIQPETLKELLWKSKQATISSESSRFYNRHSSCHSKG